MPVETDYEAALAVAQSLLHKLDTRPLMPRHERLAIATYAILDAIRQADHQGACLVRGLTCPIGGR